MTFFFGITLNQIFDSMCIMHYFLFCIDAVMLSLTVSLFLNVNYTRVTLVYEMLKIYQIVIVAGLLSKVKSFCPFQPNAKFVCEKERRLYILRFRLN